MKLVSNIFVGIVLTIMIGMIALTGYQVWLANEITKNVNDYLTLIEVETRIETPLDKIEKALLEKEINSEAEKFEGTFKFLMH